MSCKLIHVNKGKGAVDRTRYGAARLAPRSYFVHHTQRISLAAVLGDAEGIQRQIDYMEAAGDWAGSGRGAGVSLHAARDWTVSGPDRRARVVLVEGRVWRGALCRAEVQRVKLL